MKIKNFEEVTKSLQLHLVDLLEKRGVDTKRNFKCLNPAHKDSTPSMSVIKPEGIRVYCHGCGVTGDIFDVVSWVDNKALAGQGFMSDTLPALAKEFNVTIEHTEITEEEQYQLDTYRAYRHAMEYIIAWHGSVPEDVQTELTRRKWTDETKLKELGVGFINDPTEFRNHLKDIGFSAGFLDDVDLGRKDIFSPGHLIFTIKDEIGRPVGFAARDLKWIKGEGPKYVNQKTTGVKCNIYQKGKRLYGLDAVLKSKQSGPVYIVEGYPDVIACHINGFNNVVATCGTSLTDDHILLLKEHNLYDVVLCFDNDTAGQDRTETLLDTKFSNHKDITVGVLNALGEAKDPDEFIQKNGINEFINLKPASAFTWRLCRFDENTDGETICKKMMAHVVSEPSRISQERMLTELAMFSGFSLKTLHAELERLLDNKEKTKDRERNFIIEKMQKEILSNPDEAELFLSEAQSKLFSLKVKYDEDTMSEDATLKFVLDVKNSEEVHDGKNLGFELGPDLVDFQKAILGENKDTLQIFGGKANSGKTSFLVKLGYEIANHIENNATVIYLTIDDSAEQLLPKWICVAEGSSTLEINQVKSPNFWQESKGQFDDIISRRDAGYQRITNLIRSGRLVIKDATHGTSLSYCESLIKYYKEKYPDRRIVFILDNFHKLRDFEGMDERIKWKTASQQLKHLCVIHHITALCTMEYTKLQPGVKPTNDNIAETVQMEYDANLIAHLWNGMHEYGDKATADMYHTTMGAYGPERRPIVEINIGKNKITSFKSSLYLKFFPASSDFRAQPLDTILAAREEMKKTKKGRSNVPVQFFDED